MIGEPFWTLFIPQSNNNYKLTPLSYLEQVISITALIEFPVTGSSIMWWQANALIATEMGVSPVGDILLMNRSVSFSLIIGSGICAISAITSTFSHWGLHWVIVVKDS